MAGDFLSISYAVKSHCFLINPTSTFMHLTKHPPTPPFLLSGASFTPLIKLGKPRHSLRPTLTPPSLDSSPFCPRQLFCPSQVSLVFLPILRLANNTLVSPLLDDISSLLRSSTFSGSGGSGLEICSPVNRCRERIQKRETSAQVRQLCGAAEVGRWCC